MFEDLRDLYQETILEHGKRPRHGRKLAAYDADASGDNPLCGDRVHVFVRHDQDRAIEAIGFDARGCAISVASADLMAEAVQGRDDTAARHIAAALEALLREGRADTDPALERLRVFIGVRAFPSRIKCVTLPWRALLAALDKGAGENADG